MSLPLIGPLNHGLSRLSTQKSAKQGSPGAKQGTQEDRRIGMTREAMQYCTEHRRWA